MNDQFIVQMKDVTKSFPGIIANDHINISVQKGEIHALLGENGAGKSTLMNILFGLYQPDEGEIYIKGEKVKISDPNKANELGIGMVHQHFMLVEPFTVTENIILGSEPKKNSLIDVTKAKNQVLELSRKYGLTVDPDAKIKDITVGMQQRVEILKILYRGADILIFDEPTAVLIPQEIAELINIMKNLVKEGKTIILITHKLKEIMAVADRVTVIRRGKVIDTLNVTETTESELAEKMVGRKVSFSVDKKEAKPKETILKLNNVHARDYRNTKKLNGISFEIKEGEILGIAGVDGNGQTELIEVITGLRKLEQGEISISGKNITNFKPRKVFESGIAHIPEDRQKRGLVLDFTVAENFILENYYTSEYQKNGFLDYAKIKNVAKNLIDRFDIRTPNEDTLARSLSGGNQQKLIIAREIENNPKLLIAAQPTRGLDVGAIEFIHKRLIEQRDNGKAVLLISLELEEILNVADRILVIYEGQIVGEVDPKKITENELGLLMSGAKRLKEAK